MREGRRLIPDMDREAGLWRHEPEVFRRELLKGTLHNLLTQRASLDLAIRQTARDLDVETKAEVWVQASEVSTSVTDLLEDGTGLWHSSADSRAE